MEKVFSVHTGWLHSIASQYVSKPGWARTQFFGPQNQKNPPPKSLKATKTWENGEGMPKHWKLTFANSNPLNLRLEQTFWRLIKMLDLSRNGLSARTMSFQKFQSFSKSLDTPISSKTISMQVEKMSCQVCSQLWLSPIKIGEGRWQNGLRRRKGQMPWMIQNLNLMTKCLQLQCMVKSVRNGCQDHWTYYLEAKR